MDVPRPMPRSQLLLVPLLFGLEAAAVLCVFSSAVGCFRAGPDVFSLEQALGCPREKGGNFLCTTVSSFHASQGEGFSGRECG